MPEKNEFLHNVRMEQFIGSNNQQVKGWTDLTAAESVEITITDEDNAIINPAFLEETKVVTVQAGYGAGDKVNDEYEYLVKNLQNIS